MQFLFHFSVRILNKTHTLAFFPTREVVMELAVTQSSEGEGVDYHD